jgi:hypothetical protein
MIRLLRFLLLFFILVFYTGNQTEAVRGREAIDVVFCLDLSGSTNGLIDDLREKLWDIINQVNTYRPAPAFRIGVVAFSRPSYGAESGYVKVISMLTDDYDHLCNELYKIKASIEKGDQVVGAALRTSIRRMNWTEQDEALKVIYVVGNGMVNLGGESYREECEQAVKRGIIINPVYCRTRNNAERELPGWREIARLANGEQFDIRIHKRTPLVLTSTDPEKLHHLASRLSSTYIYYGEKGKDRYHIMANNDNASRSASEMTFESRLFYKISDRYQFHQQMWDLVDYIKSSNSDLKDLKMDLLHDSLRFKTPEYVRELAIRMKDERNRVIVDLRKHLPYNRQEIINAKLEERLIDKSDILERVVINSLNKLASEKGFSNGYSVNKFLRD